MIIWLLNTDTGLAREVGRFRIFLVPRDLGVITYFPSDTCHVGATCRLTK